MSSTSYVLAEYTNQTRKIQGEWSRRSYKSLLNEIRSKFSIDFAQALDIKVYDRPNNTYFIIDKQEMRFIPRGGLIRIVKSKTPRNKTKPNTSNKPPMKPPGVPPYSKQDDLRRNQWQMNSRVEIYSEAQRKWEKGQIEDIFNDTEGEWLVIRYGGFRTKEIQRFSNYIRPIQPPQKTPKKAPKFAPKVSQKPVKPTTKTTPKTKVKPKAKKAEKNTTQSKYRKKEKLAQVASVKANEIHIGGNSQHMKRYIDRACVLLRGYDSTKKGVDVDDDDDEKKELETYNVIELYGRGRAMGYVVSTAEIVKRIFGKLYQVTILESVEVTECWVPLEQGLHEVETRRPVPQLRIILAVNEGDIDSSQCGYQEPIGIGDFFSTDLSYRRGGGGGKGGKSGGKSGGKGKKGRG